MKIRDGIYYSFLAFTCIVIVGFCLYFRQNIDELRGKVALYEEESATLKLEQYELKSIMSMLSQTDLTELKSVYRAIGERKDVLVLRVSEDICMNCYFLSLQKAVSFLSSEHTRPFDVIVLGKHRFDASLHNDLKDLGIKDLEIRNSDLTLPLDELTAPYFLYFNENMELSRLYIFEKGDKTEDYINFLNSL